MVTCYICRRDFCRTFNKFYYLGMINLKYIYIYTLCKETDKFEVHICIPFVRRRIYISSLLVSESNCCSFIHDCVTSVICITLYILFNNKIMFTLTHVNAKTLITGLMISSGTNSPSVKVSTQ